MSRATSKLNSLSVVAILILNFTSWSFAAETPLGERKPSPLTDDFNNFVLQNLDYWHVPGFSIAIVDGNETFSKGYGISTFPSQNATPHTLFYTGSTTKAFTAAAIALLIDDFANTTSPLSWSSPISTLIRDDFVLPDEYATAHVTLEDAASHRTGMPRHDASYGGKDFAVKDVVRSLRNLPMTAELRTRWQYCNMMYMTLSHVIETLTGSWLGDVLWDRIWKPLNMTRTYFSLAHAKAAVENGAAELATGYMWNNLTKEYVPLPWMDLPAVSGAGAIISNVLDYAQWLRFLMDKAEPLSEMGHDALRTPRINTEYLKMPVFTGTQGYALGWDVVNYRGEPLIMHDGGLPGFGAIIAYLPRKHFGIAMMGNTDTTSNFVCAILGFRLLDDYFGIPEEERFDYTPFIEGELQERTDQVRHAKKHLFPTAPSGTDALPLSRPLEAYTGLYSHPGYRNLTITLASAPSSPKTFLQSTLGIQSPKTDRYLTVKMNRSWPITLNFEHVSGEFFIVRGHFFQHLKDQDMNDPLHVETSKAEFRVGENGKVSEFGASVERMMGEEKIWFRKVE